MKGEGKRTPARLLRARQASMATMENGHRGCLGQRAVARHHERREGASRREDQERISW